MKSILFALLATAVLSAAPAFAQGLLDNALDDKPAPAAAKPDAVKPAPDPAAQPRPDPAASAGGVDISNPDAVKKVDEDELLAQLMKPGAKPDPQAIEQRLRNMVTRMGESATRLGDKDPGEVTQEVQRRIVADLDLMIELARQQQQNSSSSSQQQQQQQPGQQRQPGQPQPGSQHSEGGTTAATNETLPRGGHEQATTSDMRNRDPANWGGLPPRDRDQISHGANEEYLSSYKDMIDRYYQALAEIGKNRR
jgi:hypothetical protein